MWNSSGGFARPLDQVAVQIDRDDVVGGQRAADGGAGVDVERVGVAPRAGVAVVIDIAGALEHPDRVDELILHGDYSGFISSVRLQPDCGVR